MTKKMTAEEKAAKAATKKTSPKQEDKSASVEKIEEKEMEEKEKEVALFEPKEEEVEKEEPEVKKEEPEVKFETFCGSPFDHRQQSDCFLECKISTPEQYERCLEHFKKVVSSGTAKKEKIPGKKGKSKKGSNHWNHLIGSQAELIDRALEEAEGPITLEQIAEFAGAKVPRTRHHIRHLQNDFKVEVRINSQKQLFLADRFLDLIYLEGTNDFE